MGISSHRKKIAYTDAMTISLTFRDLKKIALEGSVEKDGITIKVERPLLADLSTHPTKPEGFIRFRLDESDPRAEQAAAEPM